MAQVEDDRIIELLQEVFADSDGMRRFLEVLVNHAMQAEVAEHLGADRHQRSDRRRGHRNGLKSRTLRTRVGALDLSVPQTRNCEAYHPSMFARWQRSDV